MLGQPWAERLIERQTRANDRVSAMVRDYQIDCEWVQNGYVMGAPYKARWMRSGRRSRPIMPSARRRASWTATRWPRSPAARAFTAAGCIEEAGHLNPLGYARGLARAVLQEGAKIFTGSADNLLRARSGWRLEGGARRAACVIADKVIFTTGAYTVGGWPKLDQTFKIQRVFVAATQVLSEETRRSVLPQNTTIHDGRGDIYVYKYNAEGRIVASMFPMGRRGRDMAYTRQVMSERLKWLHPQIREEIRWDYFWFGELDMQYRTVPRFYDLAPGVVALTGLSGRGVPTGSMLARSCRNGRWTSRRTSWPEAGARSKPPPSTWPSARR